MSRPLKLDYVIERVLAEPSRIERRTLKRLAGVRLSTSQAQTVWPRILEHKWYLSERLKRAGGMRVATVDYFERIELPTGLRSFRLGGESEGLPPRLPMMLSFGERA